MKEKEEKERCPLCDREIAENALFYVGFKHPTIEVVNIPVLTMTGQYKRSSSEWIRKMEELLLSQGYTKMAICDNCVSLTPGG